MTNRSTILALMCGILLIVPVGFADASGEQPVASINGITVTEEDIDRYLLGILPLEENLPEDPQTLLRIKQTALAKLISKQFYAELLESATLTISDEELDQEFDKMLSVLPDETIEEMKRMVNAVKRALEAWHAHPADEKQIFQTYLAEIMSYRDWGAYQNAYNVLKGAEKAEGWKKYLKVMSRQGLTKQIKWEKLKQSVTKEVVVEKAAIRREYEHNHPKPEYWDVLHYYHLDEDQVRQAAEVLPQDKGRQEIQAAFHRLPKDTGGVFEERIPDRAYFPFYAGGIRELKEGEVGSITSGVLTSDPNRGSGGKSARQYYHLLYVDRIGKCSKALPFENVRADIEKALLRVKKETVWQDWLLEQYKKSDIRVIDKRFEVPDFSDQYEFISVISSTEDKKATTIRSKSDQESLPPSQAVGQ